MHPLRDREQAVVFTMTANQLKAYRQAMLPGRERQVDARQTEQGPATAEQRVAGGVGALRRFAGGTGREQNVEALEQRIDTTLRIAHLREVASMLSGRTGAVDVELIGTAFQQRVWQALLAIPYGQTRSYAEQAQAIGLASAVRAVANANARNPIAIIVPCHRVIGSKGALTGYAGGLLNKATLLKHEARESRFAAG